jgi:predicted NAD-dependent protein-ADP-ribosyltransferase YbiA (DUF1768 family)
MRITIWFLFFFTSITNVFASPNYPDHWWKPVLDSDVPTWEILPQAALKEKNEVIISKRNELGIMSNFAGTPLTMLGTTYASLEGLWQSMKYPENEPSDPRWIKNVNWPKKRSDVEAQTAFDALRSGKDAEKIMIANNIKWVSFRGLKMEYKGKDALPFYDIIEAATRAKIDQNPEVKKILLSTGDLKLRPDHHEDKDATKAYRYYDIYMKLRTELQKYPNKKLYSDDWFTAFNKKHSLEKIK